MNIYIMLFVLSVSIAGSAYLGYLSGIHSKRNHAYRRGYENATTLAYVQERMRKAGTVNRGN